MFLASIAIPALLGPCVSIPTVKCEGVNGNLLNSNGIRLGYQDIIFAPFATPTPTLQLYQVGYPHLIIPPMKPILSNDSTRKNTKSSKGRKGKAGFSDRSNNPPIERNIFKDHGHSTHYTSNGSRSTSGITRKDFYTSLVKKLLFKPRSRKKEYKSSSSSNSKLSAPQQHMSALVMSAPGWGWGKGGGSGGGGDSHGGGGISLLDLLLLKLTLLSLGGFLLNLLLNLASLFGFNFGMMTSTATYPVTTTSTATFPGTSTSTSTATSTGTAGTGQVISYPTVVDNVGWGSALGSGLGITGRTIDSIGDKGWGWGKGGDRARIKFHVKLPHHGWGWSNTTNETTTTTTTTELPSLPAIIPSLTGNLGLGVANLGYLSSYAGARSKYRPKRETFKPYVDPVTSLEVFSRAVMNSIESARNQFECIEKIHCENNKQARVVGQWLDYFMPMYSFSLSFLGHRMGAHQSLFDHLRAIVLGVTETNCQTHFPRC